MSRFLALWRVWYPFWILPDWAHDRIALATGRVLVARTARGEFPGWRTLVGLEWRPVEEFRRK